MVVLEDGAFERYFGSALVNGLSVLIMEASKITLAPSTI